jgi:hypothetical protein
MICGFCPKEVFAVAEGFRGVLIDCHRHGLEMLIDGP